MLGSLKEKLARTRDAFRRVGDLLRSGKRRDEILEGLEEALIRADVGVAATEKIVGALKARTGKAEDQAGLEAALRDELVVLLSPANGRPAPAAVQTVILMVGVNGGGKTTSAAKLAARLKRDGRRVMFAAADTFRAAAQEQLAVWGRKLDIPVVKGSYGADPASVVFDAVQSFKAQRGDVLLVDTAGRIHTNANLMAELEKVRRVVVRELPAARVESLLVLDATVGQNAVLQAREFLKFSGLTGIFLTKVDGTAKGGAAIAVAAELGLPIRYLGLGEGEDDIADFSPREFVEALLA
ncbi:MAG TPA: signal recognition particle-docking protein FtsY [Candidatus Aminicenantes bacterium]|nr:signal recognition particle-docking protein FtsY [Candidatus Aminicenantes bacterium]HRY64336.1 signal recognition particle-docking protein FtsY [Candidatus Aminicenantes bacterium]HRZ71249.1 signal recognition particle-docking protein FtsY [Candidatus Aminicenantes bacterium]